MKFDIQPLTSEDICKVYMVKWEHQKLIQDIEVDLFDAIHESNNYTFKLIKLFHKVKVKYKLNLLVLKNFHPSILMVCRKLRRLDKTWPIYRVNCNVISWTNFTVFVTRKPELLFLSCSQVRFRFDIVIV